MNHTQTYAGSFSSKKAPSMKSQEKGSKTHYVCQIYRREKKSRLRIEQTIECRDAEHAKDRAQRTFDLGRHAGVDAYSVIVDTELGDAGMPTFLVRLGDVPDVDESQ